MTPRKRAVAQPEGKRRAKPGTKGEGDYFRIAVRSKEQFTTFRYYDIGEKGHILRLAGKRSSSADTHSEERVAYTCKCLQRHDQLLDLHR